MPHILGRSASGDLEPHSDGCSGRLTQWGLCWDKLRRHSLCPTDWRRCCCLSVCCMVSFLVIVAVTVDLVLLSLIFSESNLHYGIASINAEGTQAYALSINEGQNLSSELCGALVVKSMSSNTPYNIRDNATLYILDSTPSLSGVEAFYINGVKIELVSPGEYKKWSFYLNRGSSVSFQVCNVYQYSNTEGIVLYLIRGSGNFSHWLNDSTNESYTVLTYILHSNCETHEYTVPTEGGRFYFVLYEHQHVLDKYQLSVTFYLQSTVFRISPSAIIHSCSILLDGSSSCSVDIPLFSSSSALLSVNTTTPIDYTTAEADFFISCHNVTRTRRWPHARVAVLIAFPIATIVIFVIVCASIMIYCILVMKRRRDYAPLPGINTKVAPFASKKTLEESTDVSVPIRENANFPLPRNNARATAIVSRNRFEDSTGGSASIRENATDFPLPRNNARVTAADARNELEESASVSAPIRENLNSIYLK